MQTTRPSEMKKDVGEEEFFSKLFAFTEDPENEGKLKEKDYINNFAKTLSKDARQYFLSLNSKKAEDIFCKSHGSGVFTYGNCPTQPIPGFEEIKARLLKKHGLTSMKIEGELVNINGELVPSFIVHQSSGPENKDVREIQERKLLQDFVLELLPTYGRVMAEVDTQEKPFEYEIKEVEREEKTAQGEIKKTTEEVVVLTEKNGRMVFSKAVPTLLNAFSEVAVSDFALADGLNYKNRGKTISANLQPTKAREPIPDACLAVLEFVSKDKFPSTRKNTDILAGYELPSINSTHDFTKEKVQDHPPANAKPKEIGKLIFKRRASGDLSQKGVKAFQKIENAYNPSAYDPETKQKHQTVLDAEEAYNIKLYQIFINKCAAHEVSNGDEVPAYPPRVKGKIQPTNLENYQEFMEKLAKIGITNPKEVTFEEMEVHLRSGKKQRTMATLLENLLSSQAIGPDGRNDNLAKAYRSAIEELLASKEYQAVRAYQLSPYQGSVDSLIEKANAPTRSNKRNSFQSLLEELHKQQLMAGFETVHGKTAVSKDELLDWQENLKTEFMCENSLKGHLCYGATTEASNDEARFDSDLRVTQKAKNTLGFCDGLRKLLQPTASSSYGATYGSPRAAAPVPEKTPEVNELQKRNSFTM